MTRHAPRGTHQTRSTMSIRIIAGEFRGRRLSVADLPGLRPTTDRMRETMFNILSSRLDLEGMRVLDLYAGSGALGIEALSRGAESVVFVEKSGPAVQQITRNLQDLGLREKCQVSRGDVFALLDRLGSFDLILADPPYRTDVAGRLLAMIPEHLLEEGAFLFERPNPSIDHPSEGLDELLDRRIGSTRLTLYQRSADSEGENR